MADYAACALLFFSVFYGQSYQSGEDGSDRDTALLRFEAASVPEFVDKFPHVVNLGAAADRFTALFNDTSGTVVRTVLNWIVLFATTVRNPATFQQHRSRQQRAARRQRTLSM